MQMLTYIEHYPHYMGTMNSAAEISEDMLGLLVLLANDESDEAQDIYEDLDCQYEEEGLIKMKKGRTVYAFDSFLTGDGNGSKQWKRIWKALQEKGFWVGQWEEGSYGIARKGFEEKAVNAIARAEARIAQDNFDW